MGQKNGKAAFEEDAASFINREFQASIGLVVPSSL